MMLTFNELSSISEMKHIENLVERFKERKEQADGFRDELDGYNERKVSLLEDIQQLERDKIELESQFKRLKDQQEEGEKMKNEISTKKLKLEELKRNREDLEREITSVISDSEDELKNQIEKFQMTKVN